MTAASDVAQALRRLKPERRWGTLARRADADLPFADREGPTGPPLLLDTTVYVDVLEGAVPAAVERLLATRSLFHHTVVLAELSHLFGRLDPRKPDTSAHLDTLAAVIGDIPRHRLESTTSPRTMIEAGILNGLLFRLGGQTAGREVAALNDATLYLHALERGYAVLTRNIRDFDLLNQILPSGRLLLYRRP